MVDIHYTKKGLKDLNYVIINVKPRSGDDPSTKGLLLGVRSLDRTGDKEGDPDLFVWVYKNKTVFILALKYYHINTLEVCIDKEAKKSQSTYFTEAQDLAALAKVHIVQQVLNDQNRTKDNGLIDISTYKHLPKYLAEIVKDSSTAEEKQFDSSNSKTTGTPNTGLYRKPTYTSTVKEVGTSTIKRITRYPTEGAMLAMKDKIEEITAGTYKPPTLKKVPADDIKEEEKETKVERRIGYKAADNSEIDDYENGLYAGMYG